MKPILLAVVLALALNQAPVEPPEYPDGQFCDPRGTVNLKGELMSPDHPCACHRTITPTPEDPVCELGPVHEHSACKQWCHPRHCHCPVACER